METTTEHRPLLYFIPGKRMISAKDYPALSLGHLAGTSPACREASGAPDGAAGGCVVMPKIQAKTMLERIAFAARESWASDRQHLFSPDTQEWHKCNGGAYWIGWTKGKPPRPVDVERLRGIDGAECQMGDGEKWKIPVAQKVPMAYGLNDDGELGAKNDPRYEAFTEAALLLRSFVLGNTVSLVDYTKSLAVAISLNYHLGYDEVLHLGLLNDRCGDEAAALITDQEELIKLGKAFEEAEKKNNAQETPDGLNMNSGETGD